MAQNFKYILSYFLLTDILPKHVSIEHYPVKLCSLNVSGIFIFTKIFLVLFKNIRKKEKNQTNI